LTPAKIVAYAVAIGVHALSPALVVGGVAAIVVEFPNLISILIGLALAGTGILMRPRTARLPDGARVLDAPARIDGELAPREAEIARELVDAYRSSLYV
jgi:hypothetical protein